LKSRIIKGTPCKELAPLGINLLFRHSVAETLGRRGVSFLHQSAKGLLMAGTGTGNGAASTADEVFGNKIKNDIASKNKPDNIARAGCALVLKSTVIFRIKNASQIK
jgi:hypothetical protein